MRPKPGWDTFTLRCGLGLAELAGLLEFRKLRHDRTQRVLLRALCEAGAAGGESGLQVLVSWLVLI